MFFRAILLPYAACLQGQFDGVPKRKNKKWCQELFALTQKMRMRCLNVFVCQFLTVKRFEIDAVSPFTAIYVTNETVLFWKRSTFYMDFAWKSKRNQKNLLVTVVDRQATGLQVTRSMELLQRLSMTLYGKRQTRACISLSSAFLSNSEITKKEKIITHSRQTQIYSFRRTNAKRQTAEVARHA